jgi:hypothetical protein
MSMVKWVPNSSTKMTNDELRELNKKRKIPQIAWVTRDLEKSMKASVDNLKVGPWTGAHVGSGANLKRPAHSLQWEWKEVIRGLDALQQVEANFQGRRFLFRSQLTADASQAVRATGVAIPPTLRELQ